MIRVCDVAPPGREPALDREARLHVDIAQIVAPLFSTRWAARREARPAITMFGSGAILANRPLD
jgi:hypothetical protein